MNIRRTVLATLLMAIIGVFLSGCGKGGECPFKKMFGHKESETKAPCETTAPAEETK